MQQALLKILEGTVSSVPPKGGRKHPEQPLLNINTKDILFICGGTFDGLEEIIRGRVKSVVMGFGSEVICASDVSIGDTLNLCEPTEEQAENDQRKEGLDNGPGRAQHRLLVADLDVPPGEEVQQLAVLPELMEPERNPAFGWLNTNDGNTCNR